METLETTACNCLASIPDSIECLRRKCSFSFLMTAAASVMHCTNYCLVFRLAFIVNCLLNAAT